MLPITVIVLSERSRATASHIKKMTKSKKPSSIIVILLSWLFFALSKLVKQALNSVDLRYVVFLQQALAFKKVKNFAE